MSATQRRRSWWRRLLWLGKWLSVAVLLLLVAGRLWLAGPWARSWIAGRIEARLGLPVTIESLSWWPSSGVVLGGVEVGQPEALREAVDEPLLRVGQLRVWPRYRGMFSSGGRVAGVEVDQARLVIAAEMLASLGAGVIESVPTPGPVPVVGMDDTEEVSGPPGPAASPAGGDERPAGSPPLADQPVGAPEDRQAPAAATPGPAEETRWAVLTGGSVKLAGLGATLGELEGIDVELPWGRGGGAGRLGVESLKLGRDEAGLALTGSVQNHPHGLAVTIQGSAGKAMQVVGDLGIANKRGVPFQGRLSMRRGLPVEVLRADGSGVRWEGLVVEGGVMGWLTAPASWQGAGNAAVERPAMAWGPLRAEFDDGEVQLRLAAGQLSVPSVRLSSDQRSLLGNGQLDRDGGAAVLRLVVPPEHVGAIRGWVAERTGGARICFKAFDPPDRSYADIEAISSPEGWQVELGEGGTVMPLEGIFEALGGLEAEGLRARPSPAIPGE